MFAISLVVLRISITFPIITSLTDSEKDLRDQVLRLLCCQVRVSWFLDVNVPATA